MTKKSNKKPTKKPAKKKKNKKSAVKKADKYPIFKQNYYQFSKFVLSMIIKNKDFFKKLFLTVVIVSVIMIGVLPQTNYNFFRQAVEETTKTKTLKSLSDAGAILGAVVETGGLATSSQDVKTVYMILIVAFIWLATVRYLRFYLAKDKLSFKETIYSCGGPTVGLFVVVFLTALKLIPIALWTIFYAVLRQSIFFKEGVNLLIIQSVTIFFYSLTLYWIIPSLLAFAAVTLPKIEPLQSIRLAKDLVVGQRVKILLRLIWHLLNLALFWMIIMIPIIMLDNYLVNKVALFGALPMVPLVMVLMTMISIIWTAVYVYFIYRRLLENDPAYQD